MKFRALATASLLGYEVAKGQIVETDDKELIKLFEGSVTMIRLADEPKPIKKGGK